MGLGGIIFNKLGSKNPNTSILQSFQQDKEAPTEFTPEALGALDKALSLNLYFEIFSVILATILLTSGLAMLLNARWGVGLSRKYRPLSIILIITIAGSVPNLSQIPFWSSQPERLGFWFCLFLLCLASAEESDP